MENISHEKSVRVFIASPFFDEEQIDRVSRLEQALLENPYVADFFSARYHQFEHLTFGTDMWRKVVFENDLRFLRRADVVVAIHDFEDMSVDSGTAFEIGYAYAMQKPILLIKEKDAAINLMLAESLHAYLTNVEEVATYDFFRMPSSRYEGLII
ncbi:nucleoside 2-deoxyribosyltransferase [Bacillus coahuilensis p1.1.43]|uniref:Nucleoside 2-deoxyribosyltransferase n=1 Tax=Bacillus coahuilensis p1.1.43 TaxID=1150625 RepID=A0A147K8X6_9BACI|nr:nucleoside 2-deoxyribosyltransferase [Bacillus coahuilensis]KUP06575.1 nucleoside 2-deoxyribosyltransferase [Bacillus coahuilensis p1.1.43]